MLDIQNEYTTEPVQIQVMSSFEATMVIAAMLMCNWSENPGTRDQPETWEEALRRAKEMCDGTLRDRYKWNEDGVTVQWVTS